jgi:hypothetical protein
MRSSIESYTHRKWLHVAGCILQSTNLGLLFYYHNGSKQSNDMLLIGDMQMKEIPLHNSDSAPRRVHNHFGCGSHTPPLVAYWCPQ